MNKYPSIEYLRACTDGELQQILQIQQLNTKSSLSAEEIKSDGFVTVLHKMSVLRRMNDVCPHIIAKRDDQVIGYALAMLPTFVKDVPILAPLVKLSNKLLDTNNYLIMGQICIEKTYRGQGVFKAIYEYYRQQLASQFHCLVTEVATDNQRSLQAHQSIGFETLHSREESGTRWELMIWEWNKGYGK